MNTDIDLLHKVNECRDKNIGLPRRAGQTFAWCHDLAGQVELGDGTPIIVKIPHMRDLRWLCNMIEGVFSEHRLHYARTTYSRIRSGNTVIDFISMQSPQHLLKGMRGSHIMEVE